MTQRDGEIVDWLRRASEGWTFDHEAARSRIGGTSPGAPRRPHRAALLVGLVVGASAIALIVLVRPSGEGQAPATLPSSPQVTSCDQALVFRPTYLPWLASDTPVPQPAASFDDELGRAQLWWDDPRTKSPAGVGLALYTHNPEGNLGERTEVVIEGVAGRLHSTSEGGEIVMSWDFKHSSCNYLELIVDEPVPQVAAVDETLRTAASLRASVA
jgi:hypothetical protein